MQWPAHAHSGAGRCRVSSGTCPAPCAPTSPIKARPMFLPASWTGVDRWVPPSPHSYAMKWAFVPSSRRRKLRLHNANDLPEFTRQRGARTRAPAPCPGPQRLQTQRLLPRGRPPLRTHTLHLSCTPAQQAAHALNTGLRLLLAGTVFALAGGWGQPHVEQAPGAVSPAAFAHSVSLWRLVILPTVQRIR